MEEKVSVEYEYTLVTRKYENLVIKVGGSCTINGVDEEDSNVLWAHYRDVVKSRFEEELVQAIKDARKLRDA